eukprot:CAMPEP_0113821396 /NCGR_PEP_ID=MMETSP0328-20130328/1717_1 /TAXON_ID=39455 /ORGANISM="Alexandrium minutum" /LENGTH=124 /DNA_ID=CAMNT_0000789327 /DNA_START=236 /DNA_END=607 /DNA_ORIENTATION=- /assembly_acc=CAM_ASM_000350
MLLGCRRDAYPLVAVAFVVLTIRATRMASGTARAVAVVRVLGLAGRELHEEASSLSEPTGEAIDSWGARVWQPWSSTATHAVARSNTRNFAMAAEVERASSHEWLAFREQQATSARTVSQNGYG